MAQPAPQEPSSSQGATPQDYRPQGAQEQPPQDSGPQGYPPTPYGPPGYWQQPYQPQPQNAFGVTGLVVGLVGLMLSWIPVLNLAFGVIATVFGALGWTKARRGQATNGTQALAGMILGIVTIVVAMALAILFGLAMSDY